MLVRKLLLFWLVTASVGPLSGTSLSRDCGVASGDCAPYDTCTRASSGGNRRLVNSEWVAFLRSNCFCDADCAVYGDCCTDASESPSRYAIPRNTYECRIINGIYSAGLPIYVVNKCPAGWADDTIRASCENEADSRQGLILNWFVSDENLVMYRNLYCAICHGKTNVTYWRARVACDEVVHLEGDLQSPDYAQNLLDRIEQGICRVKYDAPGNMDLRDFVRFCKPLASSCPANWTEDCVRSRCEGGQSVSSYVYSQSRVASYKNVHCAKCNDADDVTCTDTVSQTLYMPIMGVFSDTTFYPLNIIFDLNPGSGPVAEYRIGTESDQLINDTKRELRACPDQHVYDPFIARCRYVRCRSGFLYRGGECVTYDNTSTDADCARVVLNQTEFTVLDNGMLFVNASLTAHDLGTYEIATDGSALVCTNLTQNYTEFQQTIMKFSRAQGIVSVVGQSISIVALTLHVIVYSMFAKLRNMAGKCVLCLAASLLVAQFLFLVGVSVRSIDPEEQFGACAMVGAVTHLAFLCAFKWMSVMAFDIWRTFAGSVQKSSTEGLKRRFRRYCVYAWTGPVLVVLVAVLVDATTTHSSWRPAYGEWLCWMNNRRALFLFFALPVAVVVFVNTTLFILTAVHICKVQKMAKTVTQNYERHRYGVYVKLFIIMGLTWVFGFVATGTDSEVLWYFFLIFNTLQGAFIFVAFVFTGQVLTLLKEKRSKLSRQYGRSTSAEDKTLSTTITSRKSSSVSANRIDLHKI